MLTNCEEELPNPYKNCVREILNVLVCHDNDFRRITIELRNLQNEFKSEMEKIEFRCKELYRPVCGSSEQIVPFTQHIKTIDDVNECFNGRIKDLQQKRQQTMDTAKQCMLELNMEKCKFKQFHERTVNHLKKHAIRSDDPQVIRNCERDTCEMQSLFVREVANIKRCEAELLPFLKQLQGNDLQYFCQSCSLKDYEWLPQGKTFQAVKEIASDIKDVMGMTLRKAFAQVQLHQPEDVKSFLAAYLINLERNELLLQEKLNIFGNFKTAE